MGTTFPSHSSMFTGLYPPDHGVRSNADTLAPDVTTLAEILREQGFSTAAFVSFKSMIYWSSSPAITANCSANAARSATEHTTNPRSEFPWSSAAPA